jgi:hypothetical protein
VVVVRQTDFLAEKPGLNERDVRQCARGRIGKKGGEPPSD